MSSTGKHILIVEDDRDIRDSLVEVLVDAGYVVSVAGDGLQALEKLEDGTVAPNLILLDLMMPVMNGMQFREAQSNSAHAHIPVALITADVNAEAVAQQLKAAGFLRKPVRIQPLLELVERILGST